MAEAQSSQGAQEQLSGIFAARYGDTLDHGSGHEHLEGEHKVEYVLTDDRGRETELRMEEEVAEPEGGTLELVGEQVTVEGTDTSGGALEVQEIQEQGTEAETSAFEAGATVTGSKPAATILCRFADSAGTTPHPPSWFDTLVSGSSRPSIDHFWREVSYNNINLSGSRVFGWYNLPHNRAFYFDSAGNAKLNLLADECTGVADAQANFPSYTTINLMFNQDLDGSAWGGWQTMSRDGQTKTYGMTWMPPWGYENVGILGHEMGHSYGLPHSSGPYNKVYDSWWDVMSSAGLGNYCNRDLTYGCTAMHTISAHKDKLGWIPASQRYTATTSPNQNITIDRLGTNAGDDYLMAKVPIDGSSTLFYTLEARRYVGYDGSIRGEAIVIHRVNTTNARGLDPIAKVVDSDNDGDPNDAGAMWVPGETFTSSAEGIKIKIQGMTAGGYDVTINPSETAVNDPDAPRVQSSAPVPGKRRVGLRPTVQALFSEEINKGTLTGANVQLYRSGASTPLGASVTPALDGRSVALKPTGRLRAGRSYLVVLRNGAGGISDLSGDRLSSGGTYRQSENGYVYWSFRTKS